MKIPPPPRKTTQDFSIFDAAPDEVKRASESIGHEDTMIGERTDRFYFHKLARTDRYGR